MIPNKNELNQNEKTINSITTDTKAISNENEWNLTGGKKKWIRICPTCHKDIILSDKKYFNKSNKENRLCISCSLKLSHKQRGHISNSDKKELKIKCPQCGKHRNYYRTILNNRLCKSCVAKNNYPNRKEKLIYGILHNRLHGKVIHSKNVERNCPKCDCIIKNTSIHYVNKNKHRWCKSCACKENLRKNNINFPFIPSFNPIACQIIEKYSKNNGYNFQHGLNGGEIYITELGYWLDGYDKDRNVVIECYEPFHYYCNGNLKQKDIDRQNNIINHLKCEFIQVKYDGKSNTLKTITTINSTSKN